MRDKHRGEGYLKKASSMIQDNYMLSDIYFLLARAMPSLGYSAEETTEYYEKSLALNPNRGVAHYYYASFFTLQFHAESSGVKFGAPFYR